jgi:hypothetical protein
MDELNRYIRTKDFLHISKGYLSRALNQAITSSFSQESLDLLRTYHNSSTTQAAVLQAS